MMEQLIGFDQSLLVAINSWNSPFFDNFMWNMSDKLFWIPLYLLLVLMLWRRYGKHAVWMVIAIGAAAGLADFISSGIIKDWVMRPRPTREPALDGMLHIVNNYRGGKYGFVSSHAADTFALALLFSLLWKNWRVTFPMMLFCLINCYSRMYLGVHYPLDILGGLVVGCICALAIYYALYKIRYTRAVIMPELPAKEKEEELSAWWNYAPLLMLALTMTAGCFV